MADSLLIAAGVAGMGALVGAMAASFIWFFGLGCGARLLAPLLARPGAWQVLDTAIAAIMAGLGLSLLLSLAG